MTLSTINFLSVKWAESISLRRVGCTFVWMYFGSSLTVLQSRRCCSYNTTTTQKSSRFRAHLTLTQNQVKRMRTSIDTSINTGRVPNPFREIDYSHIALKSSWFNVYLVSLSAILLHEYGNQMYDSRQVIPVKSGRSMRRQFLARVGVLDIFEVNTFNLLYHTIKCQVQYLWPSFNILTSIHLKEDGNRKGRGHIISDGVIIFGIAERFGKSVVQKAPLLIWIKLIFAHSTACGVSTEL